MKTWQTWVASTLILAAAGSAVALMVSRAPEPEKAVAEETRWQIESMTVALGLFRPEIRLVGQLVAEHSQTLTTPLASEVVALSVREGDRVSAGQDLLQLDDFDTRQRLRQLQADLADVEARLEMQTLAQRLDQQALAVEESSLVRLRERLQQQTKLVDRGLAPQQQLDDLQAQVEAQQLSVLRHRTAVANHPAQLAQLESSREKLRLQREQAERDLTDTRVRAPFDGRIARVAVSRGDRTQPSQPLLTLYSDSAMQLQVILPNHLAGRERELLAGVTQGERYSELRFDRAEAMLDAGASGFRAWFSLPDGDNWLPGSHARVTLALPASRGYRVPEAAVFQDSWVYSVTEEGRLQAQAIEVLGVNRDGDRRWLIVHGPDLSGELRLMTTRLNNPVTGMRVYEPGIDPDPELVPQDDPAESAEAES